MLAAIIVTLKFFDLFPQKLTKPKELKYRDNRIHKDILINNFIILVYPVIPVNFWLCYLI